MHDSITMNNLKQTRIDFRKDMSKHFAPFDFFTMTIIEMKGI